MSWCKEWILKSYRSLPSLSMLDKDPAILDHWGKEHHPGQDQLNVSTWKCFH